MRWKCGDSASVGDGIGMVVSRRIPGRRGRANRLKTRTVTPGLGGVMKKSVGGQVRARASLSVLLWVGALKVVIPAPQYPFVERDSKLVHGSFPVEGRPHGPGQHIAYRQR